MSIVNSKALQKIKLVSEILKLVGSIAYGSGVV